MFLSLLHDTKLENRETLAALCCINVFLFKVINDASSGLKIYSRRNFQSGKNLFTNFLKS